MEFWNDEIIEKSWERLIKLEKELNFILIGGWAVYLYTKLHKSKDIDIIIDYPELRQLQSVYILNKNDRLRKYEVKLPEGFDIDIYTPNYSKLSIPINDIIKTAIMHEGFMIARQEVLLMLKISAFIDRKNSIKGKKDLLDILGLIFYADIDFKLLNSLALKYKHQNYIRVLLDALKNFDLSMVRYINLNENSFAKLKKKYIAIISKLL